MAGSPVLSVVIPAHNAEPFVGQMLASLERNLDPGFEFLFIDDGSTDGTAGVVHDFTERLPGLRVISHPTARGLADARNAGIDAAQGRFVTFLDADDWLAPGYLPNLAVAIEELGCDFVRVDHVQVTDRRRVIHRAPEARRHLVLDPRSGIVPEYQRTMVDYPYAWAGVYRRGLGDLLRFPAGLHTAEDRPWIWRLHREAESYAVVSIAGIFYRRQVSGSLTQIGDARQLHFLDAFVQVLDQVWDEPDEQRKAIRQFLAVLAHHLILSARFSRSARREMRRRAADMLAGLPVAVVCEVLPRDSRAALLWPLLPVPVRAAAS